MNIFQLSWKNLVRKPLNLALSLTLFALGIGLITLVMLLEKQLNDKLDNNLAGINLVVGAKRKPAADVYCVICIILTIQQEIFLLKKRSHF